MMVYLDNAATTFPKPKSVIDGTLECIKKYCGNPGRGTHKLSTMISEKIYETRELLASFLGIDSPENVVFCENATHALNLAIKTTIKPSTHVLISDMEHNSVLRPIYALSESAGVEYSVFDSKNIDESIPRLIKNNTKYIVSTLASNVVGREISLEKLSYLAAKFKLTLIVDSSQLIGHKAINLSKFPCNILCAPGHKALFGIQGVGFAVFSDKLKRPTLFEGGSGNDSKKLSMPELLPERFEAGTLPSPSIVSLYYGLKFIEKVGLAQIEEKLTQLTNRYVDIISSFENTVLYECGNGIVSFNVGDSFSSAIAEEFNKYAIYTRSGLHCAPLAHRSIGTIKKGCVRISLSYLNSIEESDRFYKVIKSICRVCR